MGAYQAVKMLCLYISNLFFAEVEIINPGNVPKNACIIYGNHNNQFVDGILLTAYTNRQISFVAAAVSVRRKVIGFFLKLVGVIPVERPNDLAKIGKGKLKKMEEETLYGQDTKFTELEIKSHIRIQKDVLEVIEIINDRQIKIKSKDLINNLQFPCSYKTIPKIDQNELYRHVWQALNESKCIGIFPEGGSHDRLSIMPFKAGICLMALGALEKYGCPITLVPAGFNYYNSHKFRSKVIIEFGSPIPITEQLVKLYKTDKKKAITNLLSTLQSMLKSVKTECETFNQLSTLFLCRQLYTYKINKKISIAEENQLNRRFSQGFHKLKEEQSFAKTYQELQEFNIYIKANRLSVKTKQGNNIMVDVIRFIIYLVKMFAWTIIGLPGVVLMGPTISLIRYQTEKQRQRQIQKSDFETKAIDVIGSYKILLALIYFPLTTFFEALILYYLLTSYTNYKSGSNLRICVYFVILMPFYLQILAETYDSIGKNLTKLKYLFIRLFKRSIYQEFEIKKIELSEKIKQLVDQYGTQVIPNLQQKRIVHKRDRDQSLHKNK